ncbi:hypothetical protein NPIL_502861 [Nephila pilipes]|uniref:Uncharacterized protein n=1 Tax=Nephila pilipes TaxID=299642 RepID=A0A8X6PZ47_NEPPI|nr:hypothetical protein NPIL_502861 [Nephila pilipes]
MKPITSPHSSTHSKAPSFGNPYTDAALASPRAPGSSCAYKWHHYRPWKMPGRREHYVRGGGGKYRDEEGRGAGPNSSTGKECQTDR